MGGNATAAALRRVAIVLASLPEPTAQRLVQRLSGPQQRDVRAALSELAEVDPLERHRTLRRFVSSLRRSGPTNIPHDAADVLCTSTAPRQAEAVGAAAQRGPTNSPPAAPLAFLSEVPDEVLAARVGQEHPQTIALILASIPPRKAARLLPQFEEATRDEAVRRLAKLDSPLPEVVEEIAGQLRNKLLDPGERFASPSFIAAGGQGELTPGSAALKAILAEMPAGEMPRGASGQTASTSKRADASAAASTPRLALESRETPRQGQPRSAQRPSPTATDAADPSAAEIHARLIDLPTERLRQALASVPTRQSLLALCGLPNVIAQQVLATLPRRQARQIRQQIAELGSLELREIDRAKAAVARAAEQTEPDANAAGNQPAQLAAA